MKEDKLQDVAFELVDDIHQKLVNHLGTEDPYTIQLWIKEVLNTVFSEYLDKEKGE